MELIGVLSEPATLSKISSLVDGIVVYPSDFSSFYMRGLSFEELEQVFETYKSKIIISLEFMLEDEETEKVTDFINKTSKSNVYYLFSDLGIYQILVELGLKDKAIYNPNTLITNSYDMNFYLNHGMHSIVLSLEITIEDQKRMLEAKNGKVFMELFGYHLMFHSKRELISLYKEFLGRNIKLDNYNSYLIEQTRKDKYHIYESKRGTGLFRPKITSYFENLESLSNLDYAFINNLFIDNDTYFKVLSIFKAYINQEITINEGQAILNSLNLEYEDGFKYQDTVYQKEKESV